MELNFQAICPAHGLLQFHEVKSSTFEQPPFPASPYLLQSITETTRGGGKREEKMEKRGEKREKKRERKEKREREREREAEWVPY